MTSLEPGGPSRPVLRAAGALADGFDGVAAVATGGLHRVTGRGAYTY